MKILENFICTKGKDFIIKNRYIVHIKSHKNNEFMSKE